MSPLDIGEELKSETREVVMHLSGQLTTATCKALPDRARVLVATHNPESLVLDLSDVDYMDSVGLGHITGLLSHMRQRDGTMRVVASRDVAPIFRATRLDRVVDVTVVDTYPSKKRKAR